MTPVQKMFRKMVLRKHEKKGKKKLVATCSKINRLFNFITATGAWDDGGEQQ